MYCSRRGIQVTKPADTCKRCGRCNWERELKNQDDHKVRAAGSLFRLFGLGSDAILKKGFQVPGTVTSVYRCWWFTVKTKAIRLYASNENTVHPHIITFSYTAEGISYEGKLFIWIRYRCPQAGETIEVYYDPEKPERYACYAFGPGITSISW